MVIHPDANAGIRVQAAARSLAPQRFHSSLAYCRPIKAQSESRKSSAVISREANIVRL